jgi:hypothetical protein
VTRAPAGAGSRQCRRVCAVAAVLGTAIIYGVENPALHYPTVAIVAVIIATNLFLVVEPAHPYVGAVSTSSDSLQEVVAVLSQPVR